jgi:hypothetical protein
VNFARVLFLERDRLGQILNHAFVVLCLHGTARFRESCKHAERDGTG